MIYETIYQNENIKVGTGAKKTLTQSKHKGGIWVTTNGSLYLIHSTGL